MKLNTYGELPTRRPAETKTCRFTRLSSILVPQLRVAQTLTSAQNCVSRLDVAHGIIHRIPDLALAGHRRVGDDGEGATRRRILVTEQTGGTDKKHARRLGRKGIRREGCL
jgi:hypothetical protein